VLVRVPFGENAVHIPLNFIVQGGNREGALIALVGNSEIKDLDDHPLRFGSRAEDGDAERGRDTFLNDTKPASAA
jgi:hypothetical protein